MFTKLKLWLVKWFLVEEKKLEAELTQVNFETAKTFHWVEDGYNHFKDQK